jgi:hypothetical protein
VQIDKSLVSIVHPELLIRLTDDIKARAQQQEFRICDLLQKYSDRFVAFVNDRRIWYSGAEYYQIFFEDFYRESDTVLAAVNQIQLDAKWMKLLRELLGGTTVTKYDIRGSQVVVAETGAVVTQINATLSGQPGKQVVADAFGLLKAEVSTSEKLSAGKRKQVLNTIENAELEASESSPDKAQLETFLTTIRETLKSAGETFDVAVGWGARLAQIATALGVGL